MPDTESDSWVMAVRVDRDSWACAAIRARTCPTRRWITTSTGSMTIATRVSRQSMMTIATSDAMTVTLLPRIEVNVLVSTLATPPTSFWRRDWITPVFVRVKNPSSIDWRCRKSRTRRSPVTRLPTDEVSHVWSTFSPADATNSPIISATSSIRSGMSGDPDAGNRARSKTCSTNSAGTTPSAALRTTRTAVTASRPRYGENSATMRRPR